MLYFRVFATHQSRSSLPSPFPFLPSLHSSLFFSKDCALFSATAASQPFAYQSLPHSFHHDGGCTPSRCILNLVTHHAPLAAKPFRIRRSKTSLPQPLYNPHLHRRLVSAENKGLITTLESALTEISPVTPVESALTKTPGGGVPPADFAQIQRIVRTSRTTFSYLWIAPMRRRQIFTGVFMALKKQMGRARGPWSS